MAAPLREACVLGGRRAREACGLPSRRPRRTRRAFGPAAHLFRCAGTPHHPFLFWGTAAITASPSGTFSTRLLHVPEYNSVGGASVPCGSTAIAAECPRL